MRIVSMLERNGCDILIAQVQFWPRVEMSRSFVLSELRRFLHIAGQNRLEMQPRTLEIEGSSVAGKLGITGGQCAGITFW